jgi:tRNA (Thr-GGU) A37 N-methylase
VLPEGGLAEGGDQARPAVGVTMRAIMKTIGIIIKCRGIDYLYGGYMVDIKLI